MGAETISPIDTMALVHRFVPTCTPTTVAYGDPSSPVAFFPLVLSIRSVASRRLGFFYLHIACAAVRLLHDLLFYCGVVGAGLRQEIYNRPSGRYIDIGEWISTLLLKWLFGSDKTWRCMGIKPFLGDVVCVRHCKWACAVCASV
jgi:hypothetical protein